MLAWAVDALVGVGFVQSGTVAGNLADVGEGVEQSEFGLDEFRVVARQAGHEGRRIPRAGCVRGRRSRRNRGSTRGVRPAVRGLRRAGWCPRCGLGTELNSRRRFGRRTLADLVEAQQCRTRIDLAVDHGEDLANAPRGRCPQSGFHLHAFQDHQRGTRLDLLAHRHRHGNNHGRSRGPDQPRLVLADAVTDAVHLDEEPGRDPRP